MNIVLVGNEKTALAIRIDRWSRLVYPVTLAIVLTISFAV